MVTELPPTKKNESNCTPCQTEGLQENQIIGSSVPVSLRLGRILLKAGHISRYQLSEALKEQRRSRQKLGKILVEKGYVGPKDVTHGLKLQLILLTAAVATISSLAPVFEDLPAHAKSTAAEIRISANVLLRSQLEVQYQQPTILITDADIEKGYIDVQGATRISVSNNNKAGYSLVFEGLDWPFKEVYILGLERNVQISSPGAFVHQPYTKTSAIRELSYRFILTEGTKTGTYPWPLSISLQPI